MYYLYAYQKTDTLYRFICIKFDNNIMSKAISNYDSFYDWEKSFKIKSESEKKIETQSTTSIGISEDNFKNFLKKWKKNNLN